MKKSTVFVPILLLIIPVLLSVTSVQTINNRGKVWYNGDYDPAYAYLYNSLNISKGLAPGHYDHPGTNMQILGAIVLKASWILDHHGSENLTESVLKDPEHYLRVMNFFVAFFAAGIILILGIIVLKFSDNIWYALLFQATPFISGLILYTGLTRLSQESMLMISSLTLAAFTVSWYFNREKYSTGKWALIFGIISGFGLVSKIIFLPLMIIPLLLLKKRKQIFRYLVTSGITFIVLTIPIIVRYPSMAWWFVNLFIHSGIYGKGDASIVDFSRYFISLKQLLTANPVYTAIFILTAIALAVFLLKKKSSNTTIKRPALIILAAVFLVQLSGFIITAKHPKAAYLLPYELLSSVTLIIVMDQALALMKNSVFRSFIEGLIIVPLIFFGIRHSLSKKETLYFNDKLHINEQAWNLANTSGNAVITVNPGPSPVAAMFFGNVYAADKYQDDLQDLYPDQYIFDTYKNNIVNWKREPLSLRDLLSKYNYHLAFIGYDVDFLKPLLKIHNISMEKKTFGKTEVAILTPRK